MSRMCHACILTDELSSVTVDNSGLCNYCTEELSPSDAAEKRDYAKLEKELSEIISTHKDTGEYDCLVTFSGGKDSTYALYLAKRKYGLKPLAVTMDHWFLTDDTKRNIETVTQALEVDHIIVRYSWDTWRRLYRSFVVASGSAPRGVCWPCNFVSERILYETLQRYHIPLYISGNSGSEVDLFGGWLGKWIQFFDYQRTGNDNYDYWKIWRLAYVHLLKSILSPDDYDLIDKVIPPDPQPDDQALKTKTFPILGYVPYNLESTIQIITNELGWRLPQDVSGTQNDCYAMAFNTAQFRRLYGSEEYARQIAQIVREGGTTREIGLRALQYNEQVVSDQVMAKLGLTWDDIASKPCLPQLQGWLDLLKPIK